MWSGQQQQQQAFETFLSHFENLTLLLVVITLGIYIVLYSIIENKIKKLTDSDSKIEKRIASTARPVSIIFSAIIAIGFFRILASTFIFSW